MYPNHPPATNVVFDHARKCRLTGIPYGVTDALLARALASCMNSTALHIVLLEGLDLSILHRRRLSG
jgi:hypothetical protein